MPYEWRWHFHEDPFCDEQHHAACGNPNLILEWDCAPVEGGCSCIHLIDTDAEVAHTKGHHVHGKRTACAYELNDYIISAEKLKPKPERKPKPPRNEECGAFTHKT
jgi:hypothetical protein